ncbi:hypothetical protein B0H11DRAFT_2233814 [Mycena galericulata]|nr:hypothetical protein B0H11DRAFT_2233814 [Mycena galericulata]
MRRAVSVVGDNVTASLNWRRDNSGSNKITRPMVIAAKARRTGVVSPAEEAAPQPTPGEVSLPIIATSSRQRANSRAKHVGLSTSRAPKRPLSSSPASEEPDAKRVRLYAPINTYAGKTLNERQCAALATARDNNLVVFGEVGSGKSLLVSAIVDTCATAESRALVLTLRPDSFAGLPGTADILTAAQLTNCLYPENKGLRAIRDANVPAKWGGAAYGRIVVDDFQTFTEDRYCVLLSFLACLPCTPLLAVLGCRRPAMMGFPAGDLRFLEHVANLIASPHPWRKVDFPESIRLTHQTSAYINRMHLKPHYYLSGSHEGPKPLVFDVSPGEGSFSTVAERLLPLIKANLASCVITAPSLHIVGEGNLLVGILNNLTALGVPLPQPRGDHIPPKACDLSGKVALMNYNQLRGSEFDLVIAFWTERCPDGLLPAMTRACKRLVVIHTTDFGSLPREFVSEYAEYTRIPLNAPDQPKRSALSPRFPRTLAVCNMVANVSSVRLDELLAAHGIHTQEVSGRLPQREHLTPRDSICTHFVERRFESVSDINGDMVTLVFDLYRRTNQLSKKSHNRRSTIRRGVPALYNGKWRWRAIHLTGWRKHRPFTSPYSSKVPQPE